MEFSETLRNLRKEAKMSQEVLAEKLNVSRQAITKWKTGGGIADIENLMAIAKLFNVSIDEILLGVKQEKNEQISQYESITGYDISEMKSYDLDLGGTKKLRLWVMREKKYL